jgi:hypothetical protein
MSDPEVTRLLEEMSSQCNRMLAALPLSQNERNAAEEIAPRLMFAAQQARQEHESGREGPLSPLTDAAALALAMIQCDYLWRVYQRKHE